MINKQTILSLIKEKTALEKIISHAEKELEKAPAGSVLVKRYKSGVQFYLRTDAKSKNGTYMPAAERTQAVDLVQKRYLRRVCTAAAKQLKAVSEFLEQYDPDLLKNIYVKEGELRQPFLRPVEVPDTVFAKDWQAAEYERKVMREDSPQHFTRKNERVRSKSEVIIANALYNAGIPYRYECPLYFENHMIYPDFTILRSSDRKELYWEHLGMMDDTEYRNNAFQRIREYEANGIFPGKDLILTFETFRMPLNAPVVQNMINHYIL